MRTCLPDGCHLRRGLTGTPGFFLGVTEPNSPTVKVLRVLNGAQPYANFKDAIDGLLSPPK